MSERQRSDASGSERGRQARGSPAAGGARIVYGIGPVRELVRARPKTITILYVSDAREAEEVGREARGRGVAVDSHERAGLDQLAGAGARHQGVVAIAGEYAYADIDDLLARARAAGAPPLLVALDGVQDPHNLGAIARSAYLLGAHGLIVPRDRAAEVTPAVVKVSAGATEHIGIAQVTNLARALEELKQAGLWLAAVAAGAAAVPLWQLDGSGPLCLVLGAEGKGIRPLVVRACDHQVVIPMAGPGVGSLNVSVAAGVALYEINRQRSRGR
jgi:23S rRNA (guanosine2251-2'-O)-methyltransferase